MTEVCAICGAPDPRWLRWVDRSGADYLHRRLRGFPGPTSLAVQYCDRVTCEAEVVARHGPSGNDAALERLRADLLAKIREMEP